MKCYAAFANDYHTRMCGSSGGIFPLISKKHINNGGIVYASVYTESLNVEFMRIDNLADLEKSFTSKYMQSQLNDTFAKVKQDLKCGRSVLFCGTPCQVSGLKKYLQKSNVRDNNLLAIDFVCHGVPNQKVFQKFMCGFSSKCVDINMRNKESGWNNGNYSWKLTFEDGTEILKKQYEIPYMDGFINNLYLRPSCYMCASKGKSEADITLGDFWGIDSIDIDINVEHGVSCVILRNDKAERLFSLFADSLEYREVKFEDILRGNYVLETSVRKPLARKSFFKKLRRTDLNQLIKSSLSRSMFKRVLNKSYSMLPKFGTSVSDLKRNGFDTIFDKKEGCCGCSACYSICSVGAISMKMDDEGFLYPIIDLQKCIKCGLCENVCPFKQTKKEGFK